MESHGTAPLAAVDGWPPGAGGAAEALARRLLQDDFDARLRAAQRLDALRMRAESLLPASLHGNVTLATGQLMFLATLPLTRSEALHRASQFHRVLEAHTSLADHRRALEGYEALVAQTLLEEMLERRARREDAGALATDDDWRAWIDGL